MGLFSDLLKGLLTYQSEKPTNILTEEDILKAIDELPTMAPSPEQSIPTKEPEPIDYNLVKVPKPKSWADFQYLGKPEFRGLPSIERDNRIYFTIPCGFEWEPSLKVWFVTFPLNCHDDGVQDFFTLIDPVGS